MFLHRPWQDLGHPCWAHPSICKIAIPWHVPFLRQQSVESSASEPSDQRSALAWPLCISVWLLQAHFKTLFQTWPLLFAETEFQHSIVRDLSEFWQLTSDCDVWCQRPCKLNRSCLCWTSFWSETYHATLCLQMWMQADYFAGSLALHCVYQLCGSSIGPPGLCH